jgi:hypothetical protein
LLETEKSARKVEMESGAGAAPEGGPGKITREYKSEREESDEP